MVKKIGIAVALLILLMVFAGGDYGLVRMYQLSGSLTEMRQEVDLLRIKNIDLRTEKQLLLESESFRKLIATEKYGMVSEGTILCRLVQ